MNAIFLLNLLRASPQVVPVSSSLRRSGPHNRNRAGFRQPPSVFGRGWIHGWREPRRM